MLTLPACLYIPWLIIDSPRQVQILSFAPSAMANHDASVSSAHSNTPPFAYPATAPAALSYFCSALSSAGTFECPFCVEPTRVPNPEPNLDCHLSPTYLSSMGSTGVAPRSDSVVVELRSDGKCTWNPGVIHLVAGEYHFEPPQLALPQLGL